MTRSLSEWEPIWQWPVEICTADELPSMRCTEKRRSPSGAIAF